MIELLQGTSYISSKKEWLENGGDSPEEFRKNIQNQPANWHWRHNKITYTHNSQGYRCPEWDDCDWAQSIIMFGCSFVFGIGVSDEDTCPSQLQKITNTPVINLGCSGSSSMFQWVNTVRLKKAGITPLKVVYVWPQPSRLVEFNQYPEKKIKYHWGPWVIQGGMGVEWVRHRTQGEYFLKETIDCCNLLWNCPVYHCYPHDNKSHIYDYIPNSYELPDQVDSARDLKHPGIKTLQSWASYIASVIS